MVSEKGLRLKYIGLDFQTQMVLLKLPAKDLSQRSIKL